MIRSNYNHTTYVSSYPIRTILVRKDKLPLLHERMLSYISSGGSKGIDNHSIDILKNCLPLTFPVHTSLNTNDTIKTIIRNNYWMQKEVSTNNALGIDLVSGEAILNRIEKDALFSSSSSTLSLSTTTNFENSPSITIPSIIQQYVTTPLLYKQSKFHCRVNVIAFGCNPISVYIHKDIICHVSCEPWSLPKNNNLIHDETTKDPTETSASSGTTSLPTDDINLQRYIHITNHTVQRTHPNYQRKIHTLTLQEIINNIDKEWQTTNNIPTLTENTSNSSLISFSNDSYYSQIFKDICTIIQTIFASITVSSSSMNSNSCTTETISNNINTSLLSSSSSSPVSNTVPFIPIKNGFEIYGFDFLLSTQPVNSNQSMGSINSSSSIQTTNILDHIYPILLEINAGPALEGLAWPLMCRRVVGDIVDLIDQFIPLSIRTMISMDTSIVDDTNIDKHNKNISIESNMTIPTPTYSDAENNTHYPIPDEDNGFIRIL